MKTLRFGVTILLIVAVSGCMEHHRRQEADYYPDRAESNQNNRARDRQNDSQLGQYPDDEERRRGRSE